MKCLWYLTIMEWTLYTIFNAAGDLIYVGTSWDPAGRLKHHARTKAWFHEAARCRHVKYPNRRAALDAEYSVIAAELPRYNDRGTDLCPRCRVNLRTNRTSGYCVPCARDYGRARRRAMGIKARGDGQTCPKCQGEKVQGQSYCKPCRDKVNAAYRATRR